ncbi:MAG: membrane protein insertase YidC, partial [Tannerellaceae bacterium]
MDKNTIIGFLLIGVVLFAFSWLNQPSSEQLEAQRRYQDSIARIETTRQAELKTEEVENSIAADSLLNKPDSVRAALLQQSYGVFENAMTGADETTVLENDLVEV